MTPIQLLNANQKNLKTGGGASLLLQFCMTPNILLQKNKITLKVQFKHEQIILKT